MFSQRSSFDPTPNRLSVLLDEKRASGAPLLDLTLSNPTRAGLGYNGPLILQELAHPAALTYEPEPFGLPAARDAVTTLFSRGARPLTTDRVMLTASTSEAYSFLFKLLCDVGDEVLVPTPSYPLFAHLAQFESVQPIPYRLFYDGRWFVDLDDVRRQVGPRTRAIVMVHPNNPTGSFLKRKELAALTDLGLPIISDEVFSPYVLRDDADRVRTALEQRDVLTFSLGGLSKFAALPQMKLGWTCVDGPLLHVEAALTKLELIADTFLSVASPVQHALPALLSEGRHIQLQIRDRVASNLHHLHGVLRSELPMSVLDVEGGWTATMRLPRVHSDEEWAYRLLKDENIIVQPGYFYDFEQRSLVVLSLLTPPAVFNDGVDRLIRHVMDELDESLED